ncbi:hypothetical protein Ccr2_gp272 [Caulobacter phage Ccr2]|uniref:Uncharacterized protein n=5 Tax=Viruses TaxID=10239 RepID=K4JPY1_9CAUD|nr:hypothetical protein D865_gp149 [Caulobacter phage phiCbK]ARB13803.1 hypothetical protein Ccr10_gp273 [Caulobacter phage Ccr10]ARB14148.1 hypothetical protein Ccr2_gp272 [Caulobacter phage Ccr2]ARB14842.1 hypothetical protein Ccr29_gp286 [Caulobacter phage Ccr29]ARB15182.1 hypothetical protein Ccr32_gp264 [Caulobacter phage Ccr32]ARB15516.1 hypothetical protein Ccr34_gp274 [Caulobacter phage Ccr34]
MTSQTQRTLILSGVGFFIGFMLVFGFMSVSQASYNRGYRDAKADTRRDEPACFTSQRCYLGQDADGRWFIEPK